jgi:hypothetical protein
MLEQRATTARESRADHFPVRPPRTALTGRRAERRRRPAVTWIVRLLLLGLAFFAGVAVGRALEDAPKPGGTQTFVRTLVPDTIKPE